MVGRRNGGQGEGHDGFSSTPSLGEAETAVTILEELVLLATILEPFLDLQDANKAR